MPAPTFVYQSKCHLPVAKVVLFATDFSLDKADLYIYDESGAPREQQPSIPFTELRHRLAKGQHVFHDTDAKILHAWLDHLTAVGYGTTTFGAQVKS